MRQWDITGELRLRLKKAFAREEIKISWPHTKIYFGNSPPNIVVAGSQAQLEEKPDDREGR